MMGASCRIGKGINLKLGRTGMTVYVASRSSRSTGFLSNERDLGENNRDCTVKRTAEEIDAMMAGGRGIPVPVDVSDDNDVAALMVRVKEECGQLDVLVCSAFSTPPNLNGTTFRDNFGKQGAGMWDACHGVGLRGSYMACC